MLCLATACGGETHIVAMSPDASHSDPADVPSTGGDDANDPHDESDADIIEPPDADEPLDANELPDADEPLPDEGEFDDSEQPLNDESAYTGPRAHFDPRLIQASASSPGSPAQFLAFPFPADHRRNADKTVRLDDFPRPTSVAQTLGDKLLDRYLAPAGGVDGFSLNAAVHVAFDMDLNTSSIPTEADAFLAASAPFKLLDIDPLSPERGTVRPLRWAYTQAEGNYAAKHSLAIAPAWGFPLREGTTYALVITKSGLSGTDGTPLRQPLLLSALLANRTSKPTGLTNVTDTLYQELRAAYAPLRATLHHNGIAIDEVAVATVFTTQNVTKALWRIASHLTNDLRTGAWEPKATWKAATHTANGWCTSTGNTWHKCGAYSTSSTERTNLFHLAATFNGRNYQQGTLPYLLSGGNFRFNASGTPTGFKEENLTLAVTIPETPMPTASGCVPIVEIAHGTGGDAYSGLDDWTAARLAARGIASVGMDQPLHGDRFDIANYSIPSGSLLLTLLSIAAVDILDPDTLLNLLNFNFLNVDSARTSIRQSAIDTMALTHLIEIGGLDVPANFSPTGQKITFCKDEIGFFGHSQGALSGSIAAGVESRIGAWLLSAGGGGLGITILDRKDFGDFPTILGLLFGLKTPNETLTELHVLMTIIQTVVDATDPINYAPFWFRENKIGAPTSQLLTSGMDDTMTPWRSAIGLATAARLSPIAPLIQPLPELDWAGISTLSAPVSGNNPDSTNAFIQWDKGTGTASNSWSGHFTVYNRPEAINASMRFLETYFAPESSDGQPLIERDTNADVRSTPAAMPDAITGPWKSRYIIDPRPARDTSQP
jgi:hypothetical protein